MANGTVTIYTIAKEAGVSPATVSRVLTNSAKVSEEKRLRIQALIDKYNFHPNALAKGLSNPKRHLIGIVAADVENPYYAAMFAACENAAQKEGYNLLLCNSRGSIKAEEDALDMLQKQNVDAIIQMGGRADDLVSSLEYVKTVNKIMETTPLVITGKLDGTSAYRVKIDESRAVELLMDHLLELGHKKIAVVGGRLDVTSTYEKYQRYVEILQENHIELNPDYIVSGGYNYSDGYEGIKKILKLRDLPTAVIAINDFAASGIIRGAREMGFMIPQDLSLVSYDNTYITELTIPSLTSIDYNYEKYGETLIQTAIAASEDRTVPLVQKIDPVLIKRESSIYASV